MSDERDPLLDQIRAAGEVPPPPDRDRARARAMQAIGNQTRRRLSKGMIALLAAALLTVPATVFAARGTHPGKQHITPTPVEIVDPGSIRETEDAQPTPSESQREDRSGEDRGTEVSGSDGGSGTSGSDDGSSVSSGDGGGDDHTSATPTPTSLSGSDGGSDGGSSSGSDGGLSSGSDGGTSGGTSGTD